MPKSDMMLEDINYKQTPSTRNLLLGGLIVLALGIGAGIGIGYGIGYNNAEEEIPTGDNDEQKQDNNCLPSGRNTSWFTLPCADESKSTCPHGYEDPPLLLISLDGFRPDYLTRNKDMVPNINKLRKCGSYAPYMKPAFPSVTFPNHYTIVTGLYPESHGIIGNNMYDPDLGVFSLGNGAALDKRWWGGEPIWNTVMKQGKRAATYFWPGSDADIQDMRPNYYFTYDGSHAYEQRIDIVLGWLLLPIDRRPHFITLYFDEPDHAGHDPGPFSDGINDALKKVDDVIGRLMDGLADYNLHNCINMVVVADHGMANRSCDQIYMHDKFLPASEYYRRSTAGTMLRLTPKSNAQLQDPRDIVDALQCTSPIATAYVKQDIPKRWHYINNIRIEDSLIPVEAGWTATGGPTTFCDGGTHGYDNLDVSMEALFFAIGPAFKKEFEVEPFENIELYNLMCEVIGVMPAPNNGTFGSLHSILKKTKIVIAPDYSKITIPIECPYPTDYEQRLAEDTSQCVCPSMSSAEIKEFDENLKLSNEEEIDAKGKHAPFLRPFTNEDWELCELTQKDYLIGYSHNHSMALYVSYTLSKQPEFALKENCVRADVRVVDEFTRHCVEVEDAYNSTISTGFLFQPEFASSEDRQMDALISSNVAPHYTNFTLDLWEGYLKETLRHWSNVYGDINVIAGPAFDYNADGLADDAMALSIKNSTIDGQLVPTHYYAVVTRCIDGELNLDCPKLEMIAFILRHMDGIQTCKPPSQFLETHIARVRDVMLLTGLIFHPDHGSLDVYDSIRLMTFMPMLGEFWKLWEMPNTVNN
ncbi:venom phosphodiesterase-like [Antedon mediterranea]|uniref:venom phosphodiesterase-like n=1 Tax=Antedon mediterranea TaxID=105859 RepID=UPI003AF7554B